MMRLTELGRNWQKVWLAVEGCVTSDGSSLLEAECDAILNQGLSVELEFSQVTYVDRPGAAALRRLQERRLKIVGCRPLLRKFVEGVSPG